MSVLSGILDAIVSAELAAGLTIGGNSLSVVKRKLPKAQDSVDAEYQVTVSGAERTDRAVPLAFGSAFIITYECEITLIIPSADALTNLDAVTDWHEAVRNRYLKAGALKSAGVQKIDVDSGILFDRSALKNGCDYDQIVLTLTTYENRGV